MAWHTEWTTQFWPFGDYTSSAVLDNATEVYNRMIASGTQGNGKVGTEDIIKIVRVLEWRNGRHGLEFLLM